MPEDSSKPVRMRRETTLDCRLGPRQHNWSLHERDLMQTGLLQASPIWKIPFECPWEEYATLGLDVISTGGRHVHCRFLECDKFSHECDIRREFGKFDVSDLTGGLIWYLPRVGDMQSRFCCRTVSIRCCDSGTDSDLLKLLKLLTFLSDCNEDLARNPSKTLLVKSCPNEPPMLDPTRLWSGNVRVVECELEMDVCNSLATTLGSVWHPVECSVTAWGTLSTLC